MPDTGSRRSSDRRVSSFGPAHSLTHIIFFCFYTLCIGRSSQVLLSGATAHAIYPTSVACIFLVTISNSVHTSWPSGSVYILVGKGTTTMYLCLTRLEYTLHSSHLCPSDAHQSIWQQQLPMLLSRATAAVQSNTPTPHNTLLTLLNSK